MAKIYFASGAEQSINNMGSKTQLLSAYSSRRNFNVRLHGRLAKHCLTRVREFLRVILKKNFVYRIWTLQRGQMYELGVSFGANSQMIRGSHIVSE